MVNMACRRTGADDGARGRIMRPSPPPAGWARERVGGRGWGFLGDLVPV